MYYHRDVKPEIVPTEIAAAMLNRSPQILRRWSTDDSGPLRPLKINRKLAWRVKEIEALLKGEKVRLDYDAAIA